MERRVVVTGMGAVSPFGLDVPSLWQGVVEARNGIGPITLFDTEGFDVQFAGEVRDFDPTDFMERKEARRTDRFVQLAIVAAQEALRTSELTITPENSADIGVYIGSGIGGIGFFAAQQDILREKGPSRVSPFVVPAMITNMAAGHVSIMTGARGPNLCTTSACASSAHALGEAAEAIKRGWVKAVLAGGTESSLTPLSVAGFSNAKALSTRNDSPETASRPFDATRDGFVMSEGAAVVMLEDLEHAQKRGAQILGELVGYGATADANHITLPCEDGDGAARAMQMALNHGGLHADEVDYINAHATSTKAGDIAETEAIKTVFGERATAIPVSASKSQFGHLLGAAGAMEAIICLLAMRDSLVPATINLHEQDPRCTLDYVPNQTRSATINVALSNSFGFGGHNVTLAFRRFGEAG